MDYANSEYRTGLYKQYLEAVEIKNATCEYRLDKVIQYFNKKSGLKASPRILDIGCSNGRFLEVAVRKGIEAWGLELSENAIAAASPHIRSRIYRGDANNIESLELNKFNIVTAFDLIEHLFYPINFLKNLHKLITKDGIIVMTTPDASSFLRIFMGKYWPMLQPFQHTILLSRKAARLLLRETAYDQISISGTKKVFTPDYLFRQLRGPTPPLFRAYDRISRVVPGFIKEAKVQVDIGEMMISASPISNLSDQ
jgi:2-polyprenyl-3-methyl-5-hydroxy-6-metoxy-1,4-benzoquinol methylase